MLAQRGEDLGLVLEFLVAALAGLGGLVDAALDHLHIGHDELEIDDFDIALRVGAALDVDDVGIVEAAHDVDDRVGRADVAEELVSKPLALGRALDQACDVDKFNDGRGDLLRRVELREPVEARIGHRDHADVRLDRAEGVVGRLGAGVRNGVKERGFADVRQSHNSDLHSFTPLSSRLIESLYHG